MDEMNRSLPPDLEHALRQFYAGPEPSPDFAARLEQALVPHPIDPGEHRRRSSIMQTMRARPIWVLVIVVLTLLLLTGVVYAVGNLLGYVYVPQANAFFQAGATLVIKQPVMQEHAGNTVTVRQAIATNDGVTVWLEFSPAALPVQAVVLKLPGGATLAMTNWEPAVDQPNPRTARLTFAALPAGTTQTTLSMSDGWQIPLEWIPLTAAQNPPGGLSDAPYPATVIPTTAPAAQSPCLQSHELQLCVLSAVQSAGKTIILIAAKSLGGQFLAGSDTPGQLVWQDEKSPLTLVDAQGNTLPLEMTQPALQAGSAQLTFSGVPANDQPVKLTIPGFYANMAVNQSVNVDLGSDPQPGTIPVDAGINVFGETVHFSSGTLIGDGTTGLRLYLSGDPVTIQDGVEPYMLEMGRPDRVDDLYGSGPLAGSKGLFVELFQYGKKLTGQLVLPVTEATAVIHGPFEFTVTVSAPPPATATPFVADPNNFQPAPTATPLSMSSYTYSGQSLRSGDLLYTVLAGATTQVYAFSPGTTEKPRLFATLPGAVSQVYVQPDHLGLDYLAGEQASRDGIFFIDHLRLYTLRFADPAPRLLYTFSPNPPNMAGTSVEGNWSFDGHYVVFRFPSTIPGNRYWQFIWLDLACRQPGDCISHDITPAPNLDLYEAYFAPEDYRILFVGSDTAVTGKPDVFLLDFDPQKPGNQPVNLTAGLTLSDNIVRAYWTPDGRIITLCWDGASDETTSFCSIDPGTIRMTPGKPVGPNLNGRRFWSGYWLSPSGKQLAATLIPLNPTKADTPELHLLDLDGRPGALLATSRYDVNALAFSPSDSYVAYIFENGQKLELFDIPAGTHTPLVDSPDPGLLTWLSWVH